jgi:hypothetical protein
VSFLFTILERASPRGKQVCSCGFNASGPWRVAVNGCVGCDKSAKGVRYVVVVSMLPLGT